ncbi:pyrroloquinoline quinone biosynthesis protein PqqF [Pseudomonas sp. 15FMM2]|uniref:Pyrroloquinoline quinone biosynthesis protein PqqF n=1 Tax=Pseudomonas imrae TaxID=2992837 RepID=A0ACC7PJL2_9PSED
MPAPAHPHYRQLTLANGLRVSLRHAPRLKRCAAVLRVAAGSHDAPLAWPGLAHFLEHLLFLGTERFATSEGLMAFVQRHGGQVNASTRERTTDFFCEVPASNFADALERLGDMLAHPRLDMDDQLREREVLQAEFIAWSQDAQAQHQRAMLEGLAADHPLRGFHAGNRETLPVPRTDFQQSLREFYGEFYQSGQMFLSLAGTQSLDELQALAEQFGAGLRSGARRLQAAPPALLNSGQSGYQYVARQRLHQLIACNAPREALDFLCTWLNASAPGGLLAQLKTRQWATALEAKVLYQFAGQALLEVDVTLANDGPQQAASIEAMLYDWLSFFAHSDWAALRNEYALLIARQQQINGALALARQDSEQLEPRLSDEHCRALKTLLDSLRLAPAKISWQLAPNNPFLQPAAKAPHAGLIRGQTSAHRGLRTFAQDRSRGRRDLSSLTFSHVLPDDSEEGALYLHWRLDCTLQGDFFTRLANTLQPLRENARQAGITLSFETVGTDWLVKMIGAHEPIPAVVEQLAQSLAQPDTNLWQEILPSPAPMIAIRELLKALPACCAGTLPDKAPTNLDDLPGMWSNARWQGFAAGLPTACELAIKQAAARLPGQPATLESTPMPICGQHLWHEVSTDSSDTALLLFCPAPTQTLADEARWRLLAHIIQAPFYQHLRVERQVGYAVFSGIRQFNGQTGLLFGAQSPHMAREDVLGHIQAFLKQLPDLIGAHEDLGNLVLARQLEAQALPTTQAAELLWQAQLAGHRSDYLEQLNQAIQTCTRQDLLSGAQQLNQAAGGWRCVANGAPVAGSWLTPS